MMGRPSVRGFLVLGLGLMVALAGCSGDEEKPVGDSKKEKRKPDMTSLAIAPEKAKQIQSEAAAKAGLPGTMTNSIEMRMVFVPAGAFMMGSLPTGADHEKDEGPRRKVAFSRGFYMSAHEVTNGQFRKFRPEHDSGSRDNRDLNKDTQPVVMVSWADAAAFCEWLSAKEGKRYRLPTEAEWEYACRAGSETAYNWGDAFDPTRANARDKASPDAGDDETNTDPFPASAPVGSFPANAWGLHDMHGNVYEWCQDWYAKSYYRTAAMTDPPPPAAAAASKYDGKPYRLRRGGCWGNSVQFLRSAARLKNLPTTRDCFHGFRVVCELPASGG